MFYCVRRASPWAKETVGLPARGCLFRDSVSSVSSVCSVDFLVAYGKKSLEEIFVKMLLRKK